MALHQRLVVEVGYTCIFDVATHIKYLELMLSVKFLEVVDWD